VGTDNDARDNIDPISRLVTECQSIVDAHDAGMFVSTETDETNPAALAIGAAIGSGTFVLVAVLLVLKREAWFKWTSAKLANQQPLVMAIVNICLQIAIFALLIRSIRADVPWCYLDDGSTLNPTQVCMTRSAQPGGVVCTPFVITDLCAHEYICNGLGAPATAQIFLILACVACWIVLVVEGALAIPRIPLEPRLGATIAIFGVALQIFFVWLTLWFYGGYLISYFSGTSFPIADEGSIVVIVTLLLYVPLTIITSAQMTLHTK
jgi:hypothetical protein